MASTGPPGPPQHHRVNDQGLAGLRLPPRHHRPVPASNRGEYIQRDKELLRASKSEMVSKIERSHLLAFENQGYKVYYRSRE
nr:hypothetical protein Iba_chr05eCG10920 [Ipomoea batatas]